MSFRFIERPDSDSGTYTDPTRNKSYKAIGEADFSTVYSYALGATPLYVSHPNGTLYRQDVNVQPDGYEQYNVTVPYGRKKKEQGSFTFSFDTTGGTAVIKCAKQHVASYPAGGGLADDPHKGAIGVSEDKVEGAEIVIPALRLSVSYNHPQGVITLSQVRNLARFTGFYNSLEYLGFQAGELLFIGASGSDGTDAPAECTYNFIASQNVTGLTFGDIAGVAKKGHEYAWIEFEPAVAEGAASTQPARVHIERVYDGADFFAVFGWG